MLEKIKAKIIHLLGGYTKKECSDIEYARYFAGKSDGCIIILSEMWSNYGKVADEWCKYMYDFTEEQYNLNNRKAGSFTINRERKIKYTTINHVFERR